MTHVLMKQCLSLKAWVLSSQFLGFFSLADAVRSLSSEYDYDFFLYKVFLLYFVFWEVGLMQRGYEICMLFY